MVVADWWGVQVGVLYQWSYCSYCSRSDVDSGVAGLMVGVLSDFDLRV